MSVQAPTRTTAADGASSPAAAYAEHGSGWVTFAGVMLMMAGALNIIFGIAAIDDSKFFVNNAQFILSNLNTWGWVTLGIGAVQVLAAFGIFARNAFAVWLGVAFAAASAVVQLLEIQAYPFWSLAVFSIDILIIYGLIAYGREAY